MSTEWTEETIREHMFTEVEVQDTGDYWGRQKLIGFDAGEDLPFIDGNGESWKNMRLIPKPKKRLMKPIELCGKWLDFGEDGLCLVCGFGGDDDVYTSHDAFDIVALNCHAHGCIGWRDTPTSELNTSFEVEE
jgi:hypothetical protein